MRELIKRLLRRAGYEVYRTTIHTSAAAQLARIIEYSHIDLVCDIGGNAGQYASALREHGYRGRIVSFEPLSSAHARLVASAQGDHGWQVAPRMALGASQGEVVIHVAGNSLSSSVLDMLPEHERAAPGSRFVGSETVALRRFDRVAPDYLKGAKAVLLKIDTQGYEDRVLAGAAGVIDRITAIQTEMSLVPLYAEQLLFDDLLAKIESMDFELFAIFPGHVHEITGRTLQVDGLFLRRGAGVAGSRENREPTGE
jgi:FkbM family methyltransferase